MNELIVNELLWIHVFLLDSKLQVFISPFPHPICSMLFLDMRLFLHPLPGKSYRAVAPLSSSQKMDANGAGHELVGLMRSAACIGAGGFFSILESEGTTLAQAKCRTLKRDDFFRFRQSWCSQDPKVQN